MTNGYKLYNTGNGNQKKINLKIALSIIFLILSLITNVFMFITFDLTSKEKIEQKNYEFNFMNYTYTLHRNVFWSIFGFVNIILILSIVYLIISVKRK